MTRIIQTITDTISQKPEIGIFGSMAGVALSPVTIISLVSAVLGLVVTVITLVIKIMDIIAKVKAKRRLMGEADELIIDNKRYKRIVDEDDAE
jgi:cell division protein FtsL